MIVITPNQLVIMIAVLVVYHVIRVSWLRSTISSRDETILENSERISELEGVFDGIDKEKERKTDESGGWMDEALEWRGVVIPFIKKHLDLEGVSND